MENAAPLGFAELIVTFAPTAVSVPVCGVLVVPSGTEPKLRAPETLRPAPVPESVAGDGVLDALLAKERLPEAAPVAAGAKATLKVEL